MNRKSKVIVSIVGITIVLLALLGLTYAYYLTRIEGNTNTNSISVTTADLKLSYSENTSEIITENNIIPGTKIGEKKFTVTNSGNTSVKNYKVVLEYAVIENVVPSVFERPQDFEITLTCKSKKIDTNEESGTCRGYTGTWNNESFEMTVNDIDEGIKHEYSLTIFYTNPNVDQSNDMGKNLNLKVQIYGENETSTIIGTINNVDETFAIKLNSNPKISTIKNVGTKENPKYQYKFIGVESNKDGESHTLMVVNKNDVKQSEGNITIKKGITASISGSTITIKDNQTNIFLTTDGGSSELTSTATFNPYSNNTDSLAYHIINNAMNNENGTEYRDIPASKVALEKILKEVTGEIEEEDFDMSGKSWYYGSSHLNARPWNGGEPEVTTTKCNDDIIGKYISYPIIKDAWLVKYCKSETTAFIVKEKIKYESSLSLTNDNDGISYYFRGMVNDNYVIFSNKCWRIVRIGGDGSIKLILESQNLCSENMNRDFYIGTVSWGYKEENGNRIADYTNAESGLKKELTTWLYELDDNGERKNITTYSETLLKNETWCLTNTNNIYDYKGELLETSAHENYLSNQRFYYGSGRNLYGIGTIPNATLLCDGEKDISKIGTLTADEVVFAGGIALTEDNYEDNYGSRNNSYLEDLTKNNVGGWWTLSRFQYSGLDDVVYLDSNALLSMYGGSVIGFTTNIRPSVSLKAAVKIAGGDGTLTNPYVIE